MDNKILDDELLDDIIKEFSSNSGDNVNPVAGTFSELISELEKKSTIKKEDFFVSAAKDLEEDEQKQPVDENPNDEDLNDSTSTVFLEAEEIHTDNTNDIHTETVEIATGAHINQPKTVEIPTEAPTEAHINQPDTEIAKETIKPSIAKKIEALFPSDNTSDKHLSNTQLEQKQEEEISKDYSELIIENEQQTADDNNLNEKAQDELLDTPVVEENTETIEDIVDVEEKVKTDQLSSLDTMDKPKHTVQSRLDIFFESYYHRTSDDIFGKKNKSTPRGKQKQDPLVQNGSLNTILLADIDNVNTPEIDTSFKDFSASLGSGNIFSGTLGKMLNEKEDNEEPIPDYVKNEMPEIEDFNSYEDKTAVYEDLLHLKQNAIFRSIFASIFTILIVYLNIGATAQTYLPDFLRPEVSNFSFGCTIVILLLGLVFSGAGTFFEGIFKLFSPRPSSDSIPVVALILAIVQGVYIALLPQGTEAVPLVLAGIAAISFSICIIAKLLHVSTVYKNFKIVSSTDKKHTVVGVNSNYLPVELKDNENDVIAVVETGFTSNFLEKSFAINPSYKLNNILAIVSLIAIGTTALIAFVFKPFDEVSSLYNAIIGALSAACISATFLGPLTLILPTYIKSLSSSKKGGAIVGYDSARPSVDVLGIITKDKELIGGEECSVSGMKMIEGSEMFDVIAKLTSIYNTLDGPLAKTFLKVIDYKKSILMEVTDIEITENEGVCGYINGEKIYVGNARYLTSNGLTLADVDYEAKFTKGNKKVIHIGWNSKLRGVFVVEYKSSKTEMQTMELAEKANLTVICFSEDFNITESIINNTLSIPEHEVYLYGNSSASGFYELLSKKEKTDASIVSTTGLLGIISGIRSAKSIMRIFKILSIMQSISLVVGVLLCAVMIYAGYPLPFLQLLSYQALWAVLGFILTLFL